MTPHTFIRRCLDLKGLKVRGFWFAHADSELHIAVGPYKNGCLCPICRRRSKIVRVMRKERVWRDLPIGGLAVFFHYQPREIDCPTHGRAQEELPWAEAFSRITYRLEFLIVSYSQIMTQKAAAGILGLAPSTLSDLLHRIISRERNGHKIKGLRSLGVDEISYKKKHKYLTIVYDLERSCVVWTGEGKGRKTIDRFFSEALDASQREKIKLAACDMSKAYINGILDNCKNARLVLDRFHIVKALNNAVDEVRKTEWRKATKTERKALKGMRWLLYKHRSNRSKKDTRLLNQLRKGNRRIHRAWVLKDEFNQFWEYQYTASAEKFLKRWCTSALRSRLAPIRKFVQTLRKHQANIITFIGCRLTNAVSEGINRIIKIIKNRASGFRSVGAFVDLIFLTIGDVDIPARITAKLRSARRPAGSRKDVGKMELEL